MANESVLVQQTSLPIHFTCANGTGIEKGALLVLADPATITSAAATSGSVVGGIAAVEKIANDGTTQLAVYRGGIFRVKCSGANITAGDALILGECANHVSVAKVNDEHVFGTALETATSTETLLVELKPIDMQLA